MRNKRFKTKTKVEALAILDLVAAVEQFGASFYFSSNGLLMVRTLSKLPRAVLEQFLDCDGRALVALIRSRIAAGDQPKEKTP